MNTRTLNPMTHTPECAHAVMVCYYGLDDHLYKDAECTVEITYEEGISAMSRGTFRVYNENGNTVHYVTSIFDSGVGIVLYSGNNTWYIGEEDIGEA